MPVNVMITNSAALTAKLIIMTWPDRLLRRNASRQILTTAKHRANEAPHSKVSRMAMAGTKPPCTPTVDINAIVQPINPAIEAQIVKSNSNAPAHPDKMRAIRMPIELLVLMGLSTILSACELPAFCRGAPGQFACR